MFLGIDIKSKINNFTSFQFFQFFRLAILILANIIFVKSNFGLENIGIYEIFMLVAGSVSFFWLNGMLQSLLSIHSNNTTFEGQKKDPLIFNVAMLMLLMGVLAACVIYIFSDWILSFFSGSGVEFNYIHLLMLYVIISAPVTIVEYFYLLKNKNKNLILYTIFTYSTQLLCVTIPAILGWGVYSVFIGLISINIFRFIWLVAIIFKYSQFKFSSKFIKEYILLALPLITSFLLAGCDQYIDGYIITTYLGADALAIYRYGAKEIPFLIIPINSFCAVYLVKISQTKDFELTLKEIKQKGKRMLKIIFPICICLVLMSKFFFPLIYSKDFSDSAIIFNIYALLIVIRFTFVRLVLLGIKDTKPLMLSSFVEIGINICLSLVFVQIWGIMGVAFATVIAYHCDVLFLGIYLRVSKNIRITSILDIKTLLIFSVFLYLAFFISMTF